MEEKEKGEIVEAEIKEEEIVEAPTEEKEDHTEASVKKKEEKAKNAVMARVGDRIRMQDEILSKAGIRSVLEWNEGGHFNDPGKRCAAGFIWCLNNED